ncbi:MAG: hypothetical protein HY735_12125 [Verrucomicrobia bacterium]|nr:hypothetical protein [Verrucomicrobiota bacterium]
MIRDRKPRVAICLLTFGDYPQLARRALDSFQTNCKRSLYKLIVGANAVSHETLRLLKARQAVGDIDHLIISGTNLCKYPMMRRMFECIDTEYVWWFDDDSFVTGRRALSQWLQAADSASKPTVLWGELARCNHPLAFTDLEDPLGFVRSAPWYRGLPPPSWRAGGKGEFNFQGKGQGDGRWFFIFGGCWMMRTCALRALDWPDARLRHRGGDALLGEAIRQQGWEMANVGALGVAINTEARRGAGRDLLTRLSANLR